MECLLTLARAFIVIVNTAILGVAVLIGGYVLFGPEDYDLLKLANQGLPFQLAMVIACFSLSSAVTGILAVCCDSDRSRKTYTGLLGVVLLVEAICVALFFVKKGSLMTSIETHWYDPNFEELRREFERQFDCCGFANQTTLTDCGFVNATQSLTPVPVCRDAVTKVINDNMNVVTIGVVSLIGAEVLLFLAAVYLLCHKEDDGFDKADV
jgi:hypothetical protein